MSKIENKLKLHRGSDLWRIMSDIIGKKSEAQKDLDLILSAVKLKKLVKEQITFQYKLGGDYKNNALTTILCNLIEESEK